MINNWIPSPGDRIATVLTTDHKQELVYLNNDSAMITAISNEFLLSTSEWKPWSHQIIDYLSSKRGVGRQKVLKLLIDFERLHTELDFDALCTKFLHHCLSQEKLTFLED